MLDTERVVVGKPAVETSEPLQQARKLSGGHGST